MYDDRSSGAYQIKQKKTTYRLTEKQESNEQLTSSRSRLTARILG